MTLEQFIKAYELPVLVPIRRVCEVVGISHSTAYELNKSGRLTVRKLGGKSGVLVEDLFALKNGLLPQRAKQDAA
ncbi:MAG TPA: hypothetical protein VHD14_00550 [Pseudolabrys sp.]|nr:hypothetical protein [Pseudolabrys sp.]